MTATRSADVASSGIAIDSLLVHILVPREVRFRDLHNEARQQAGLAPMDWMPPLDRIALTRCTQMVQGWPFGHAGPHGDSEYAILLAGMGLTSYTWAGENLAQNQEGYGQSYPEDDAQRAFTALMASPGHRDNILFSSYNRFGIGSGTNSEGLIFWATIFLELH